MSEFIDNLKENVLGVFKNYPYSAAVIAIGSVVLWELVNAVF
jgi:hypothetical protein